VAAHATEGYDEQQDDDNGPEDDDDGIGVLVHAMTPFRQLSRGAAESAVATAAQAAP
jgi:hypothetical protein